MWLFTTRGFFSAVRTPEGQVMVRGRVKADMDWLSDLAKDLGLGAPQVLTTPRADYRYRVLLAMEDWVRLAAALAGEVDYPNFKDRVHGEPERDRAYLAVWSAMNRLQAARAER